MTFSQQLSVRKEKLDVFSPDYVNQLASEGVISFDGRRYGFGHESFFDYVFARLFVTRREVARWRCSAHRSNLCSVVDRSDRS